MLFQNSKFINSGQQKLTNMTNDTLSTTACEAIEAHVLDNPEIERLSVTCTNSAENQNDTTFSVWDVTEGCNSYIFSVDNDGVIFND